MAVCAKSGCTSRCEVRSGHTVRVYIASPRRSANIHPAPRTSETAAVPTAFQNRISPSTPSSQAPPACRVLNADELHRACNQKDCRLATTARRIVMNLLQFCSGCGRLSCCAAFWHRQRFASGLNCSFCWSQKTEHPCQKMFKAVTSDRLPLWRRSDGHKHPQTLTECVLQKAQKPG